MCCLLIHGTWVAVKQPGIWLSVFCFYPVQKSQFITNVQTRKATLFHWAGGKYLVCANSASCICRVAVWPKQLACNAEYKFDLHWDDYCVRTLYTQVLSHLIHWIVAQKCRNNNITLSLKWMRCNLSKCPQEFFCFIIIAVVALVAILVVMIIITIIDACQI